MAKLRKHLYSLVHEGVKIEELSPQFRVIPLKCNLESEPIAQAKEILNSFSKEETQLMWAGASLPLIHVVVEEYSLEPLLVGFGMAEDNEHGLNESFSLEQFRKGFMFGCLFFQNIQLKS